VATFLARRYMRGVEAVGRREQLLGVLILMLMVALVVGFVLHVLHSERFYPIALPAPVTPAGLLPRFDLEGWHGPTEVAYFAGDRMYEKINGQAEEYLRLGAIGLTFGRYEQTGDPTRTLDVYCFHLPTPQAAQDAYRAEKPAGATELAVGAGGYEVGGAVFLTQGVHYVQVLPSLPDEDIAAAAHRLAHSLAQHLSQRPSAPADNVNADE